MPDLRDWRAGSGIGLQNFCQALLRKNNPTKLVIFRSSNYDIDTCTETNFAPVAFPLC